MELPQFKYNPNAYKIGIFEEEKGICSICDKERTIRYVSSFYSIEEPNYICPWCIQDGSAAKKYDGNFNDYASIEGIVLDEDSFQVRSMLISEKTMIEITKKTPSYISWQQQVWLVHCNEPCFFIDYADNKTIQPLWEELKDDIENKIGMDIELIKNHLTKNGSLVGYLFQCVKCGQHRLHVDCD